MKTTVSLQIARRLRGASGWSAIGVAALACGAVAVAQAPTHGVLAHIHGNVATFNAAYGTTAQQLNPNRDLYLVASNNGESDANLLSDIAGGCPTCSPSLNGEVTLQQSTASVLNGQSTASVLNQSTASVLNQSTASVLNQSTASVLNSHQEHNWLSQSTASVLNDEVDYYGTQAPSAYINQPMVAQVASGSAAHALATGRGMVVALIDNGVDPFNPVLSKSITWGEGYNFYDGTPDWSAWADLAQSTASVLNGQSTASVLNQSTASVLNGQSTASVLNGQSTASVLNGQSTASVLNGQSTASVLNGQSTASVLNAYRYLLSQSTASVLNGQSTASVLNGQSTASVLNQLLAILGQSTASVLNGCTAPGVLAQSTASVLNQSTASVLNGQSTASVLNGQSTASVLNGQSIASVLNGQSTASVLNQSTASVLNDLRVLALLNQSTASVLNQSTASVLNQEEQLFKQLLLQLIENILSCDPDFGHGTAVAGIIHLIAPNAKIMPITAFGPDGTADTATIVQSIDYAIDHGANVINMSFSSYCVAGPGTCPDPNLVAAINEAKSRGIVMAGASGNDGSDTEQTYPASFPGVLGVGAIDYCDAPAATQSNPTPGCIANPAPTLAGFSNYDAPGTIVDAAVGAPGVQIYTTFPGFGLIWATSSGTSFSTPIVAGEAALLGQLGQSGASVNSLIESSANSSIPGSPNTGSLGYGLVQVLGALKSAPAPAHNDHHDH